VGPREAAFVEFRGNRQYATAGNVSVEARVCLIMVDYRRARRLKVFARLTFGSAGDDPDLVARLMPQPYAAEVERLGRLSIEAFAWSGPRHITPRFSTAELAPLTRRLSQLERENARLRDMVASAADPACAKAP
jgi:predicted pyridoxine 5'-phosphate oxidase superfamily flavin-nucleotide-binding protein